MNLPALLPATTSGTPSPQTCYSSQTDYTCFDLRLGLPTIPLSLKRAYQFEPFPTCTIWNCTAYTPDTHWEDWTLPLEDLASPLVHHYHHVNLHHWALPSSPPYT